MRLRLKRGTTTSSDQLAAIFERLEAEGLAEDMTFPEADGTYVLWMVSTADNLTAALTRTVEAIQDAERAIGDGIGSDLMSADIGVSRSDGEAADTALASVR